MSENAELDVPTAIIAGQMTILRIRKDEQIDVMVVLATVHTAPIDCRSWTFVTLVEVDAEFV